MIKRPVAMHAKTKLLIIISLLFVASQWSMLAYYLAPPPDYSQGKVVLYATDWCPYCEKTRALLKSQQIAFKEVNIETSEEGRAQYQRLAGNGVPVLLIAGEVVRGYNENRILAALHRWQNQQASAKSPASSPSK